jgi:hypothetical protein
MGKRTQGLRGMPPYEQRLHQIPYPRIKNPDGSFSTHRMAADVDKSGNWFAYPLIQKDDTGRLRQLPQNEAFQRALRMNNYKAFGGNKAAALEYARGGYKRGTNIEDRR